MNSFIAKTLYKDRVVRMKIFFKDRRVQTAYCVPENNTIKIKDRSFTINPDDMYLEKGMPTYLYNADDPTPVPLNPLKWNPSSVNTIDFHLAIEEHVSQSILQNIASEAKEMGIGLVLGIAGFLILAVGLFLMYRSLNEALANIKQIYEFLRPFGGF